MANNSFTGTTDFLGDISLDGALDMGANPISISGTSAISIGDSCNADATGSIAMGVIAQAGGDYTIAIGDNAGTAIATNQGADNIAIGREVLNSMSNILAVGNIGVGYSTLTAVTQGLKNTVVGYNSGILISTGIYNIVAGADSGNSLTSGANNVCLGRLADCGAGNSNQVSIGYTATTAGGNSISIGQVSTASGAYGVAVGYQCTAGTNEVVLGATTSTRWKPVADNATTCGSATYRFSDVYAVSGSVNTSDRNQKKEILDSDLGLDFINELRPVKYKWKDGKRPHYGLISQEVEDIITRRDIDFGGWVRMVDDKFDDWRKGKGGINGDSGDMKDKPAGIEKVTYGLRYHEFIAPLIKAVQELTVTNNQLIQDVANLKQKVYVLESK